MRIIVDMQGAQTESRSRGIGRYAMGLARGLCQSIGSDEAIFIANDRFTETADELHRYFRGQGHNIGFRVWKSLSEVTSIHPQHARRREAAERIREGFLRSLSADAVLVTSLFEGFGDDAVTSIGSFDQTPTCVVLHDLIPLVSPDRNFRYNPVYIEWYKRKLNSLRRASLLLANSDSSKAEAEHYLRWPKSKVVTISAACDDQFRKVDPTSPQREAIRHLLRHDGPFVLASASGDERKNIAGLVRAYALLPEHVRHKFKLVICGGISADVEDAFKRIAVEAGLQQDTLRFTGYIPDHTLVMLYSLCSVFVCPSLHEGFGLPPLEAMFCGALVLASDRTSLPEVCGSQYGLFDPTSTISMAAKIEQALTDRDFRSDLFAAQQLHKMNFSWESTAQKALAAVRSFEKMPLTIAAEGVRMVTPDPLQLAERPSSILVVKLDHLGDLLLAVPAIRKLRARYPETIITGLIGSWAVELAKELKLFDHVHCLDIFSKQSSDEPQLKHQLFQQALHELPYFDMAIDLRRQPDTRSVLLYVKAGLKVGYTSFDPEIDGVLDIVLPSHGDLPFQATKQNKQHISHQMLRLVDSLPGHPADYLPTIGRSGRLPRSPLVSVGLFPQAGNSVKEWPRQHFVKLVRVLLQETHECLIDIYLRGAGNELANDFCFDDRIRVHIDLDTKALFERVSANSVCVANNSFGAHLASFLGTNVVAVYGGHERHDEWAPPFGNTLLLHREIHCNPCHLPSKDECQHAFACLADISPDLVAKLVLEVLPSGNGVDEEAHLSSVRLAEHEKNVVRHLALRLKEDPAIGLVFGEPLARDCVRSIARNHRCTSEKPLFLFDISELIKADAKTGIQRVVRALLAEFLTLASDQYNVRAVYAKSDLEGFFFADRWLATFTGASVPPDGLSDALPVTTHYGDVFFSADVNPSVIPMQQRELDDWHRRGVSITFMVHDILPVSHPEYFPEANDIAFRRWLDTISRYDVALCNSEATADALSGYIFKTSPDRLKSLVITSFPLGSDIEATSPSGGVPEDARVSLDIVCGRPTFLMVGTLEPRKQHMQVLHGFQQLWSQGVDVSLIIVGKRGWMCEQIVQLLADHPEANKRLLWLEAISDEHLQLVYERSHTLVAASAAEGYGLPIAEAQKHGLDVIARDIPVFREVSPEDRTIFFADTKHPDDISKAINTYLERGSRPNTQKRRPIIWRESAQKALTQIAQANKNLFYQPTSKTPRLTVGN